MVYTPVSLKWQPSWYTCPENRFLFLAVETRSGPVVEFIPFGAQITPYHITQLAGKMRLKLAVEKRRPI